MPSSLSSVKENVPRIKVKWIQSVVVAVPPTLSDVSSYLIS